ncbi:hypothetical protein QPK31_14690 [Massilia sp. YIM B02769]|uniref:hypothetical protein n=1 Tax=Massilia sp. YIM B02769 TaxID=3050129 RepID=UPI0025B70DE9|nr:hypothetical protein [Massilia sp. YIM B02769]MDN4059471.1 hypothetical protein [Massilia sp. YIM B02769]
MVNEAGVALILFSSLRYLEGLRNRIAALRIFAKDIPDASHDEGRDQVLRSRQWGRQNTSENWENNAGHFLVIFSVQ